MFDIGDRVYIEGLAMAGTFRAHVWEGEEYRYLIDLDNGMDGSFIPRVVYRLHGNFFKVPKKVKSRNLPEWW